MLGRASATKLASITMRGDLLVRCYASATKLPSITATQRTSLLVAAWRDAEMRLNARPLCHDPYASVLLQAFATPDELAAWESHPLGLNGGVDILATRTRLMDSWLERPTWPPVRTTRRQTVLLGAGMDARPYRMGFSRYVHTIFEVDADVAVLEAKHAALEAAGYEPRCTVKLVGADVSDTRAVEAGLEAAGFDPRLPTRWLAEGLLEYLPPTSHPALFEMCHRLGGAAGSGIAAQALEPPFGDHVRKVLRGDGSSSDAPAALPYEKLVPIDETLAQLRDAGWRSVRGMRSDDITEATGRSVPEGYNLVFAEADPLTAE